MAKIIALSNQKGGVGKSITAASLGIGIARKGKNGDPRYVPKREPLEYSDDRVYCSEWGLLCDGCPYPHHGFICRFSDNTCLKTEMNRIARKEPPPCRG